MAQWLIIAGIILIIGGIFLKRKVFKHRPEKRVKPGRKQVIDNVDFSDLSRNMLRQKSQLNDLSDQLDKQIIRVARKEKELEKMLSRLDRLSVSAEETAVDNESGITAGQRFVEQLDQARQKKVRRVPAKYKKVMELLKKGEELESIAAQMNMGVREAETVIRLYSQGAADHVNN